MANLPNYRRPNILTIKSEKSKSGDIQNKNSCCYHGGAASKGALGICN